MATKYDKQSLENTANTDFIKKKHIIPRRSHALHRG